MSTELKREYLRNIRLRYHRGSKKQRTLILDEFCKVCGLTRKHAIRLLNEDLAAQPRRPGPKRKYGEDVDKHLRHLWESMGRICSKKMVAAMPLWLPFYHEADVHMGHLLGEISAATIDRHLEKFRDVARKGLSSTSPSLIKNKIPIELLDHEIREPGFIEADTVAHCGTSLAGEFTNTLTMTDVFTGWTENRAMFKKESRTVLGAIRSIEKSLPFKIKGFASDNGNEFLNHDLHSYFFDRKDKVNFVRRRPYKKNDNAHVEQKNWTHVRELFGYSRFSKGVQVKMMNEIYKNLWNPLWNFFTPVMKLESKERVGGKIIKLHSKPKTPYHRLMDSGILTTEESAALKKRFEEMNPFELKKELEKQLKWFFRIAEAGKQEAA
jgi:hypothetical protein